MNWHETDWFLRTAKKFADAARSNAVIPSISKSAYEAVCREQFEFLDQARKLCEESNKWAGLQAELRETKRENADLTAENEKLEEQAQGLRDELAEVECQEAED